jgi:tol-pal system protein YbgF
MIGLVIPRCLPTAVLAVLLVAAAPAAAANKDIERLALQVAALQAQLTELSRSGDESRGELKRLADLVAEQNALLRKAAADRRQQDEALTVGLRELGERFSELAESLQALKAQGAALLPPPTDAGGLSAPASPAPATAGATPPSGAAGSAALGPAAPAASVPAPRELYSQAYADFARGNYDLALQGFGEYLRAYPGTDFSDNAQYWIGECQYGKKLYTEAIDAWNVLLKDYPTSDKLPDARVKKGMALERLGRRGQALVEYRFVVDRFPTSQAARIARERLNP